jgi:peroxiredoxin
MNKLLVLILSIFVSNVALAADGYTVKANIKNANDSMVFLCHYFGVGKTVFKDDSAKVSLTGESKFTLKSTKKITGGIYLLLFADRKMQVELLLQNGDNFEISFDRNEPIKSAKFSGGAGSTENTNFYEYQNFLMDKNKDYQEIQAGYAAAKTKADSNKLTEKSTKFNKSITEYRKSFAAKYPGSLCSAILKSMEEPEVPEKIPFLKDGKTKDSTFGYRYYKTHYWDGYNLRDERLVYTPILDPKLETYLTKLVIQTPDSFCKEVDTLLRKVPEKSETYKYILWFSTRHAENSKVMGMDESFVYLVEKYYMQGKAYWLEDSDLKKYDTAAKKLSTNTIGKDAPEIMLPDINGNPTSLKKVVSQKDYTLLAFYDPTCGHCQKEVPAMDSAVRRMIKKNKSVQIFGVENAQEDEKWKKFIDEKKLKDFWYHVHDPYGQGRYRRDYNVTSNPIFYLIDKQGKIVGKRFDHNNLEDFMEFLEKKNALKKNEG